MWGVLASPPGHVSTIGLGPAAQGWVTPQGPEVTATHAGLDFVSTGHQAKISQVPFCSLPARRQRPVLTPAGVGEGQCQEPPGSNSPSAPSPVYSRPHHFQPQPAPQEGSRCPHSTRHPECSHSARRERVPGGGRCLQGPLLRTRSHPRVRPGVPPLPVAAHPLRTCFSPEQCRYARWCTHPPGPLEGVETPASGEGWTPSTAGSSPTPSPALCTKTHLGTGFLPLVGGHDQVGDYKEDILSLRNQREVEEPPPATGVPPSRGCLAGGGTSAWVLQTLGPQNQWIPLTSPLTSESQSRCP